MIFIVFKYCFPTIFFCHGIYMCLRLTWVTRAIRATCVDLICLFLSLSLSLSLSFWINMYIYIYTYVMLAGALSTLMYLDLFEGNNLHLDSPDLLIALLRLAVHTSTLRPQALYDYLSPLLRPPSNSNNPPNIGRDHGVNDNPWTHPENIRGSGFGGMRVRLNSEGSENSTGFRSDEESYEGSEIIVSERIDIDSYNKICGFKGSTALPTIIKPLSLLRTSW